MTGAGVSFPTMWLTVVFFPIQCSLSQQLLLTSHMIIIQQNSIHSPSLIQSQLVRWGLPPLINTLSGHLLSNVGLFNTYDPTIYDLVTLPWSYLGSWFWLPWTHCISCFKHLRFIIQIDREIEGDINHRIKSRIKMEKVRFVIETLKLKNFFSYRL